MASRQLIIFVKNSEPGKVKTRLAATVGNDEALNIYSVLLAYTQRIIESIDSRKKIYYSSFIPNKDEWDIQKYEKYVQTGGDLGDRMRNAFEDGFEGSESYIILIGSDCAELESQMLKEAFQKLSDHDVVIGPARDGGYYLIGMNGLQSDLFKNIEWSTANVFNQTMMRANKSSLKVAILPELNDVDTYEDWLLVKHKFDRL